MLLPRVVSLLPSATEIAVALGLRERLYGRSHECDFPEFVRALPVLTATKIRKGLSSIEIDRTVQSIVQSGLSVYEVNAPLLRSLKPDVILTQSQCAICAVTPRDLEEALSAWTGNSPLLISLAPDTLEDVWGDFIRVAQATQAGDAGVEALAALQARMQEIRARTAGFAHKPQVAAIEWMDPLMAAGNWVPELVLAAGGIPLFAAVGQHSPWLAWQDLAAQDPDVIVMMPCGYQIAQSQKEMPALTQHPLWQNLKAVRAGQVFIADGHHFFNRPGPRLVESVEILAEIFHGPAFGEAHYGRGWRRWAD